MSIQNNPISTIYHCKQSGICLLQSPQWGASLCIGEDENSINKVTNGFTCQLPDGAVWAVKNGRWYRVSVSLADKQSSIYLTLTDKLNPKLINRGLSGGVQ